MIETLCKTPIANLLHVAGLFVVEGDENVVLDGGCFDGAGEAASASVDAAGDQFLLTGYRMGAEGRICCQAAMELDHGVK